MSYRPIWREQELGVRRSSWELPGGKMRRMHVASPVRQVASPVGPGCVKRGGPSANAESALRTGLGGVPAHKRAEKTAYRREQDFQGSESSQKPQRRDFKGALDANLGNVNLLQRERKVIAGLEPVRSPQEGGKEGGFWKTYGKMACKVCLPLSALAKKECPQG